jgi:Rps23 Pro-64 3,4-dihydroxylase Tpa1-like proline 4-hydroxylase
MSKTENAIIHLSELSKQISHGHGAYLQHCLEVYNILTDKHCSEDVRLAGLYHSVYGTEFFDAGVNITRETVRSVIGEYAEELVHSFCTIENRDLTILNSGHPDLFDIALANLESQTINNTDPNLLSMLDQYKKKLMKPTSYEQYVLNSKNIFIFDDFLQKSYIEYLHDSCLSANYTVSHGTSKFTHSRDERLACYLTKDQFFRMRLDALLKTIATATSTDFYAGSYYMNCYSHMAQTSRHCDSSVEGTITILVFPNKHWESTWGGEIKFYNEVDKFHYAFDFVPGRVIAFDSQLEHEVLPLTIDAKKMRFSIAIKCAITEHGYEYLEACHGSSNIIKIEYDRT